MDALAPVLRFVGGSNAILLNESHPSVCLRCSKYYVGDLITNELPVFPAPNEFHKAIRSRVAKYFKDTKQDPKFAWPILGRYLFVYGLIGSTYYLQFFYGPLRDNLLIQSVLAVLLGWGCALVCDYRFGAKGTVIR